MSPAIPRVFGATFDERRNTSRRWPVPPDALPKALSALAALRRNEPQLVKWIEEGHSDADRSRARSALRRRVPERRAVKLCLYCLRPFTGRGRCCSEWCARKVSGKAAWVTRSRREASARIMATIQKRARHVPRFRQLAMGDDPTEHIAAIFGTLPAPSEPRHGDTLDAP